MSNDSDSGFYSLVSDNKTSKNTYTKKLTNLSDIGKKKSVDTINNSTLNDIENTKIHIDLPDLNIKKELDIQKINTDIQTKQVNIKSKPDIIETKETFIPDLVIPVPSSEPITIKQQKFNKPIGKEDEGLSLLVICLIIVGVIIIISLIAFLIWGYFYRENKTQDIDTEIYVQDLNIGGYQHTNLDPETQMELIETKIETVFGNGNKLNQSQCTGQNAVWDFANNKCVCQFPFFGPYCVNEFHDSNYVNFGYVRGYSPKDPSPKMIEVPVPPSINPSPAEIYRSQNYIYQDGSYKNGIYRNPNPQINPNPPQMIPGPITPQISDNVLYFTSIYQPNVNSLTFNPNNTVNPDSCTSLCTRTPECKGVTYNLFDGKYLCSLITSDLVMPENQDVVVNLENNLGIYINKSKAHPVFPNKVFIYTGNLPPVYWITRGDLIKEIVPTYDDSRGLLNLSKGIVSSITWVPSRIINDGNLLGVWSTNKFTANQYDSLRNSRDPNVYVDVPNTNSVNYALNLPDNFKESQAIWVMYR
uniref:Apple domain-containing protein n=1 Tax=viral metagenome TaxID=1070528 RepID=A0A6C0AE76_9ZZZZ